MRQASPHLLIYVEPATRHQKYAPASVVRDRGASGQSANLPRVSRIARGRQLLCGLGMAGIVLLVPFAWRVVWEARGGGQRQSTPSYLPALEFERPREPFVEHPIAYLRDVQPRFVVLGDSMAGRIEPDVLGEIGGGPVAPILQNATGSAYWYLAFKNYVRASGVTPRWVIVFFRDTNMTDVMFRLDGPYRSKLDEVAGASEPELNAAVEARLSGGWRPVHRALDAVYRVERTREWLEPLLGAWPARIVAGPQQTRLLDRVNASFELEHLRPMAQADMAATDEEGMAFDRYVDASVLPLLLSGARDAGVRLCLIRVLRRPVGDAPSGEPEALTQYSKDLRAYVEARGGVFFDDRDDPALARLPYADGDHVAREARAPYTRRFWEKLRALEP